MHPSLHLSRLSRLPSSSRRFAAPVLCQYPRYPSPEEISQFSNSISFSNRTALVPVYYHLLDPLRIPRAEYLERWTDEKGCNSMGAMIALASLFFSQPPQESASDLWPRVSAWINFILTFEDFLRGLVPLLEHRKFFLGLMTFCHHLCDQNPENLSMIASTPGFRVLTVHAWHSISDSDFITFKNVVRIITKILTHGVGITLAEVVEGSDGDLSNFAKLIMRQCESLVPQTSQPSDTVQLDDIWLFQDACAVLAVVDNFLQAEGRNRCTRRHLCEALLPLGFVKTIAMVASAQCDLLLSRPFLDDMAWRFVKTWVSILELIFRSRRPDRHLRTAIQYGLLRIVQFCSLAEPSDDIHQVVGDILRNTLTPATVFYSVVTELGSAQSKLRLTVEIRNETTRELWSGFRKVLRARHRVLLSFNNKDRESRSVCDNLECGKVLRKRELKRCSGCLSQSYCSSECQALDWQMGHNKSCVWHLQHRKSMHAAFTPKEYAFLRYLLSYDCHTNRAALAVDYVQTRRTINPGPGTLLLTVFDYTTSVVKAERFKEEFPRQVGGEEVQYWNDIAERVMRSSGRMSLDTMRVREGSRTRDLLLPMRWGSSEIPDALEEIVVKAELLDKAQLQGRINEFMLRYRDTDWIV
ncbi:hypothetical protein R3P38DRAFT_3146890 [Favolaschia claudopus]|uniref:MYND-type domain-containing protein n=1 Tax=Favolaschia claudopus TaxID=2862362 RepID=A0AAV9Z2I7_9AGAR